MSYSQDLSCLAFQALWGQAPWDSVERGRPPQGTVFHRERFYLILLVSEQSPRDREPFQLLSRWHHLTFQNPLFSEKPF